MFFTSNFDSCYNLRFRNDRYELRQKLKVIKWIKKKKRKLPRFRVFNLPYTLNRKLGNLRKCSFTSNFYRDSKALFFLRILILSHIFAESFIKFPHVHQCFGFSNVSLLRRRLLLPRRFCNLLVVTKKLMTSAYNTWCRHFLTLSLL